MDFSEKYDKYAAMLYRICVLRLASKEDAEDALQDVFVKYFRKSPQFSSEEDEKSWLIRVAVNTCKDYWKSFWNTKTVSLENAAELFSNSPENAEKLIDIFKLSPKYRTVLQLYYYEGYSVKEIADILNKSPNTILSQLSRARKQLKLEMEDKDYEQTQFI